MYIKYESGEVEPSVKIITKLCQLYKVSYSTILGELNFSQEKTDDLYNTQKSEDFYVASPDVCYGAKKTYSPLQSKAINQIKELSDFQVISVLAYMKLLNEEIAENSKNKQRKSMAGIIDSVDPIEVERINAVYDKIPK